jgi:hypothetical protein
LNPAGLIAVAYLLFSLSCRVQLGVRLVFPLVAMLNLAAVVAVARPTGWPARGESMIGSRSRREQALLAAFVAFTALTSLLSWPHGLRFANHLWGGRERAAEVLTDSNYDWGQGLPELRQWYDGTRPLRLWYYGTDPACLLPPFELVQVNQIPNPSVDEVQRRTAGGYFAVGESFFTACPDRRPGTLAVINWLKGQIPAAVVGTFRVYVLPPP